MIGLPNTTDKLELITSAAGDVETSVEMVERVIATEAQVIIVKDTDITTATTTDISGSVGAGTSERYAQVVKVRNAHATTSNTVTLQRNRNATINGYFSTTLLPGEFFIITEAGTLFVYTANGAVKSAESGGVDPKINDFRLTGVSATPVMTANSTTLSTIYLAAWRGNRIALFDGVNWQLHIAAAEPSLAVTGRTTDLPFDIFGYTVAGVVTLEFLNWTNATTRATGLTRVDGVWTKAGDATRRYLGSCRARSATTFHFVQTGDDSPCKFDLWNTDNRIENAFTLRALTNTWAYTLATWRQAQASANYQADVMVGLQEENLEATLIVSSRNATISIPRQVGIGFDSTTAFIGTVASTANTVASIESMSEARIKHQPSIGRHFYAWLEISTATGTCTWIGDDGALRLQSGMTGTWFC